MANNLPEVQKTNWVDSEIVRPVHTNGWGEAINKLSEDLPIYANVGTYYNATYSNGVYSLVPCEPDSGVSNVTVSEYLDGMTVIFKCPTTNLGACSVNINSLGVKNIKTSQNTDPASHTLLQGNFVSLIYDKTNGYFKLDQDTSKANISLDNISSAGTTVINTLISTALNSFQSLLLNRLYPVGSIYIGTQSTCPLQTLGIGSWTLISGGRVLQGSTAVSQATQTIDASLPTLTAVTGGNHSHTGNTLNASGTLSRIVINEEKSFSKTGVFEDSTTYSVSDSKGWGFQGDGDCKSAILRFNTSGRWSGSTSSHSGHTHSVQWANHVGTTVQPNVYIVNIWRRVS